MIERIERFRFDGKEFRDLDEVGKHVEGEIGKVIDSTPNRLHPRDALAVYEALIKNRDRLVALLTASYYTDPDEMQSEKRSIFDRP